jgi:formylglycine-generating enzyme required for sulfatase activity
MAGNAWEWTTSALTPGQRVVRGGSFYHDRNSSRSSNREVPEQTMRDLTVGMRVCAGWK